MDLCHRSCSLFKEIFAVANAKAPAFKRRVGNAKHQFSQLVRRAVAEDKLTAAHLQPEFALRGKTKQPLPAVAYRPGIVNRKNRALQLYLPQRMRRSETLGLQADQPGVILFAPLQNERIDQAIKVAVNGEDPPADNVALRIVALAVDDRRNPQALLM